MAPLYRKALVVGATSGIGEALAAKLVAEGTSVVVAGRRQERLDAFVQTHGPDMAEGIRCDVSQLGDIPAFASTVISSHPDLDCVVVNSGIQRGFDFTDPESVDFQALSMEMTTNYLAAVHLTTAFLPHLKAQKQAHLVYVSATLGLIPSLINTPNYNASKSALHTFILDVRQQLRQAGQGHVRMVEVFPPAVQTELHDTKHQPHLQNGGEIGMPLAMFTTKMYEGLVQGSDQFAVGPGEDLLKEGGWEAERTKLFQVQNVAVQEMLSKYLRK